MAGATTLFLCGDVMTGRGVDRVLPQPSDPILHESYVPSATEYVELAEKASGPIPKPVAFSYIWGDAAVELDRIAPTARIVNLETSITTSGDDDAKGINNRMQHALPRRSQDRLLRAREQSRARLRIRRTGRDSRRLAQRGHPDGRSRTESDRGQAAGSHPANRSPRTRSRLAMTDSGAPPDWAATDTRSGIALLLGPLDAGVTRIAETIRAVKQPGDIVILSPRTGAM